MISALLSFLGSTAFRMAWGEISHWFTSMQDHKQEMDKMRLQEEIDAAQHARNLEAIKLQSDLGVKVIQAQADADIMRSDVEAWANAVADVGKTTGIKIIDIWNGVIRPLLATMALIVVVGEVVQNGFNLNDWDRELVGAILGLYVADRALAHRGK